MMKQTLKNLVITFINESQARNRYSFFASIAKKEGYEQIAEIFLLTAENEFEHAEKFFEHIQELRKEEKKIDINVTEAPLILSTTKENLRSAIEGENEEWSKLYPEFASIAQKEKLPKIAKRFLSIAVAEKHHSERYVKILKELESKTIFKKSSKVEWVCRKCGYISVGMEPPEKCPSCDHEKSYYQVKCEEY